MPRLHLSPIEILERQGTSDAYRICEMFDVADCSGATQYALAQLLASGGSQVERLQGAVQSITRRIDMLQKSVAQDQPWTEAEEQQVDLMARQADESHLPDALSWDGAPCWAMGLVSTGDPSSPTAVFVWVPSLAGDVVGVLAKDVLDKPGQCAGARQNCALSHPDSQWLIVAVRPFA
ncbi:hypothetical protein [Pseudomonas sp. PS01301]|uniref:hypothetical protein n=1 Tax=Pseudomonas sp. PS01301 TaxID=2991437 RepID=UPI00249B839C|nr:hypothetical protein [Pseudomonas sp. PS01301]